jgi:hypothetical protein
LYAHPYIHLSSEIVNKTAAYVARVGAAFEAELKVKHGGNKKFSFLLSESPFHAYYQFKIQECRDNPGGVVVRSRRRPPRSLPLSASIRRRALHSRLMTFVSLAGLQASLHHPRTASQCRVGQRLGVGADCAFSVAQTWCPCLNGPGRSCSTAAQGTHPCRASGSGCPCAQPGAQSHHSRRNCCLAQGQTRACPSCTLYQCLYSPRASDYGSGRCGHYETDGTICGPQRQQVFAGTVACLCMCAMKRRMFVCCIRGMLRVST